MEELLLLEGTVLVDKQNLEWALSIYENTSGVSFTDCVILSQVRDFQPDEFLAFDRNLLKFYQSF